MSSKRWVRIWFLIVILTTLIVGGVNYLIDPLALNNNNLFNLRKAVQSIRDRKVLNIKKIGEIDNLVLGSSRAMRIDPDVIGKYIDGKTFNFSIYSAFPEDYYGILLYLERLEMIPKNIVIGFDFYILNDKLLYDHRFVSNKDLNFIEPEKTKKIDFFKDYLNADTLILSIETIYNNIIGAQESSSFNDNNGFLYSSKQDEMIKNRKYNFMPQIKTYSAYYFKDKYKNYNNLSKERIGYLEDINTFILKYDIKLYAYITPVHCYHLNKIKEHETLHNTLNEFKSLLMSHFTYIDFMIDNKENCKKQNYYDAVHPSPYINKLIVNDLFSDKPEYGIKKYSHRIKNQ